MKPSSRGSLVLGYFAEREILVFRYGSDMRVYDNRSPTHPGKELQKFERPVEMIKEAATKYCIEFAIFRDVPNVVLYKAEVRKLQARPRELAGFKIAAADFDPQGQHSHA